MGTSSSGGGASGRNPLIPTWVPGGSAPGSSPNNADGNDGAPNQNGDGTGQPPNNPGQPNANPSAPAQPVPSMPSGNSSRYRQPRSDFNKFLRGGGRNTNSLKSSLRGYSRNAAGSTSGMARRMAPSAYRVAGFLGAINTVKEVGKTEALKRFHLETYVNKPLSDILSALSDEIFKNVDEPFANTQDDNITKNAYANTVTRVCELDGIDLDKLNNENIEVMTAIFIEETIVQRVLCDIGNNMTTVEHNIQKLVEIENNVYQIVNGMVRNKIMPEIKATQRGDKKEIEKNMENIYRIAFDAMADLI